MTYARTASTAVMEITPSRVASLTRIGYSCELSRANQTIYEGQRSKLQTTPLYSVHTR
jgi:hypothetical protein